MLSYGGTYGSEMTSPAKLHYPIYQNQDSLRGYKGGQVTHRHPSARDTSPGHSRVAMDTEQQHRQYKKSSTPIGGLYAADRSRASEQALDNTKDSWDYLQAELDLSPRSGEGRLSRPNVRDTGTGYPRKQSKSPGYPRYGGQANVSRHSEYSPNSRSLLASAKDDLDRSTASKDSSTTPHKDDAGTPAATMDRPISTVSHADIQQSVLSYRERWERSRRDRDSLHLNRSSSEPNRDRGRTDSSASVFPGHNDTIRSRSYDFATDRSNRSILRDPDLSRSIADTSALNNRSAVSNGTYADHSITGSLRRDPVTHRKIPNGSAKPIRESNPNLAQHRSSLTRSRSSLSKGSNRVTLYGRDYGVHNSLVNMALYSLLSLVFCALGLQLLLRLSAREAEGLVTTDSVLQTNESYRSVQAVAVTFSSAVVMLNLCCLLTCSLQCFFAAKLVKCPQGEERAFKYIKECTGTRSIAVTGFFLSIPIFFLAIMLYVLMEYRATAAIIAVVIATIGTSFTLSTMVHSAFFWRVEKARADCNVPPYDDEETGKRKTPEHTLSQSELSTLV